MKIAHLLTNNTTDDLQEGWSNKYKKSINCSNPKGFSQRAHCAGRKARQAHSKTKNKSINEAHNTQSPPVRDQLNAWMNLDQQYNDDPTRRKSLQIKVWPYIQKNIESIMADLGPQGNGDYPAAPFAAWLLVQHMDAFPQNQVTFYKQLAKAIPHHPKLQFLKDRAAVNAWIQTHAQDPEYYHNGKPLPDPTINVRNPAIFKDSGVPATSREQALQNAIQAGNKLLVAAVRATNAQTQPSYTQTSESLQETHTHLMESISPHICDNPRGFSQRARCAGRRKRQAGDKTSSHGVGESRMDDIVSVLLENLAAQGLDEAAAVSRIDDILGEDLRKWFRQKWVRFGPDGKIRGACARGKESEGKPKCLPQSKAHALGKKGRAKAARRKRREDPNPDRKGKARNVATKESSSLGLTCPECGGLAFGDPVIAEKKDACYHKVRSRYKVWPSAYASGALVQCRKKGAKNWGNKSK